MVDDEVITYITARMERGFRAASRLVEHIDRIALSQHRRITIPLAKQVMEATD
jgi:chromosomal replication initiation ATPase DnaA